VAALENGGSLADHRGGKDHSLAAESRNSNLA
jgi:hypothetical protein